MRHARLDLIDGQGRAELENFDVLRFDHRSEGGKVDLTGAGGAMIFTGELHIMNVEAGQAVTLRLEVQRVIDEAQVFLDLGMPVSCQ